MLNCSLCFSYILFFIFRVEELRDSTAHAEMICIREASNALRSWRLAVIFIVVPLQVIYTCHFTFIFVSALIICLICFGNCCVMYCVSTTYSSGFPFGSFESLLIFIKLH